MKTSKHYKVKADRIHSLADIIAEKERLKFEIHLKEEHIHNNYRNILEAFTFRNLATNLITDLSATSNIVSKVLSFGKSYLERRRKKKKEKLRGDIPDNLVKGN